MAAAIALRADYWADDLRTLAKASRDARQTRRLLALAAIYDGSNRSNGARIGGVVEHQRGMGAGIDGELDLLQPRCSVSVP